MKEKIIAFLDEKIAESIKYYEDPIFGLKTKLKVKGAWAAMLQIKEFIETLEDEE